MHEFELEGEHTRQEVADYLHKLANGLEENNTVTFISGEQSTTIDPPRTLHFRMETDEDSSWIGSDKGRSFNMELGWEADEVEPNDDLIIVNQPGSPEHKVEESGSGTADPRVDESDRV